MVLLSGSIIIEHGNYKGDLINDELKDEINRFFH